MARTAKPTKRVAPRERYESLPLTDEERETLKARWEYETQRYQNPDMDVGFDVSFLCYAAALGKSPDGKDEIHLSCRVNGAVIRPELEAVATGATVTIRIPAKVQRKDGGNV